MVRRVPPTEVFGRQNAERERQQRDVRDALRIDGSQFVRLYEKMQALIANLGATVEGLVSALTYTKAQTDAKVASPGSIAPGNVTASGNVSASGQVSGATGVFNGGLRSVDVNSHLLTYGGGYSATWCHVDGTLGTVPSSRIYKRDIETAVSDPAMISRLRVVTYRYIDAVERLGDGAETEIGLIAEEVHELGLPWLVVYRLRLTEAGQHTPVPFMPEAEWVPFSVRYDRIGLLLLMWAQRIEDRLAAAGI